MKERNMRLVRLAGLAVVGSIAASSVEAHVTVEPKVAAHGPFKAAFGVPHGCSGSSTTALRITIPEGIIGVKPMPKPGWTVDVKRSAYARTYDYFHGAKLSEGVVEIEWSGGKLRDEHFDEFILIGFISDAFSSGDAIPFAAIQICEVGTVGWTAISKPGTDPHSIKTPAPSIKVRPR